MKKTFLNFNDIEVELRRLDLEREIAKEELKSVKGDLKESLQPAEWMQTGLKVAGKIGSMMLLKKLFRK
ncbi:hypothetical protein CLV86_1605 [Lacinutrix venerupis]|uniref:Glutaminyl-tRNA synthetase n=1 Tax=Lacinutrix venerupis TaxID=1486034 RepID=A0AAC9PWG2_9FLAO|nr:hypothetical protein [Lacinutrix venerupis]APY00832.1 hypothetical protein BWR22_11085 [Lacinutrix venerupis]RLJ64485.1 hypothetical protein CLV86_1605 [Lacinutrix venerupis]